MNNWVALILTPFIILFVCVWIFMYRHVEHENKSFEIDTQKALEFEYKIKRVHEEACIEQAKQIEDLIQMVATQINIVYREFNISVRWQYNDEIHNYVHGFTEIYPSEFPIIKLIVEHKYIPQKQRFAYGVYYIHNLIVEKKRNGATSELFKSITKHIDEYKNEIKGLMPVVEVINND